MVCNVVGDVWKAIVELVFTPNGQEKRRDVYQTKVKAKLE